MLVRSHDRAGRAPSPGPRFIRRLRPVAALGTVAVLTACGGEPVVWKGMPEARLPAPPATAAAAPDAAADTLVQAMVASFRRGERPPAPTAGTPPDSAAPFRLTEADRAPVLATLPPDPTGTRCPVSVRVTAVRAPSAAPSPGTASSAAGAHAGHAGAPPVPSAAVPASGAGGAGAGGAGAAAVWWAQRPDGSAALYLSRTADGGRTWSAPMAVDTVDRSERGCDRPAPSIAVDSANGYLHVAYAMRAPEGPGVFYAHQMDPRGPFEPPQVIVYGDRPGATSVASAGDRVVVAYEDPNTGGRPFVSLALSRTAGHSWAERVPVSASNVASERPQVALRGADTVVLGWVERSAPRELATTDDPRAAVMPLPSGVVVRLGRLRP